MSVVGFIMVLLSQDVLAQQPTAVGDYTKNARNSFNELSDISRNITKILDVASKDGDLERVQCISSRQASISALVDISQQAQSRIELSISSNDILRADSEMRKISVALSKAKQFATEVESCLASQSAGADGNEKTKVEVDKSGVAELIIGDESVFGLDTLDNQVVSIETGASSSSTTSAMSSETTAPPPPTSPFE